MLGRLILILDRHFLRKAGRGFVLAAKNQQAFDKLYYKLLGLSAENFSIIPRPAKWAKKNLFITQGMEWISRPAALLWSYFFFYCYIAFKFIGIIAKRKAKNYSGRRNARTVAYAICDRSCDAISKSSKSIEFPVWLIPNSDALSNDSRESIKSTALSPTSLLTVWEIFLTLAECIKIHSGLVKTHGVSIGLQSYALGEWLLMLAATIVLSPKRIIIAEHHDRWAVLADLYCTRVRESGGKCLLELVQHGKEYRSTYDYMKAIVGENGLPYRLENVSMLYVYNQEQELIFKDNILSPHLPTNADALSIDYISTRIELTDHPDTRVKILFVGHPICEDFQSKLYLNLALKKNDSIFLYKPHPTAAPSNKVKSLDWEIIDRRNFFPRADLVISYPSTLADEYEIEGINVLVHPLESGEDDIEVLARKAEVLLRSVVNKSADNT